MIGPAEYIGSGYPQAARFIRLTESLRPALLRRAAQLTRNGADAEDLVQETYLRAFQYFGCFQTESSIRPWMMKILKTIYLNQIRKAAVRQEGLPLDRTHSVEEYEIPGEGRLHELDPRERLTLGELDEDLSGALEQLPASCRDLLMLSAIGDYTYEELAELQLCPVGTVRSRLSRAKEFLRQRLGQLAAVREPVYN